MRILLKIVIIEKFGSQSNFAKACGKSDSWLSRIITGRRDVSVEEKDILLSLLQVDYGDRLFKTGITAIGGLGG